MKVYVVRHGESETNKAHRWTGWLDVSLTEKGKKDALFARSILENVKFDKVYTSDLSRAIQTAEIAIPGCSYQKTPLIREMNVGNIAGKSSDALTPEMRRRIPQEGYTALGGESQEQFGSRIREFMASLEALDCENVAVFSHAGCLKRMLSEIVGTILPGKNVLCANCTVAIFEYTDSVWRLHSWINP